MLQVLRIRQFAIVESVEVEFGPGLNVVTGETGAGKSILVRALQLVLGARCGADVVRTGADRAEIEALFDVDAATAARLEALGVEPEREIVIRRTIYASGRGRSVAYRSAAYRSAADQTVTDRHMGGRGRAYVNGQLTTLGQLQRIAAGLVDISSQHEHHSLVDAASHLTWLDAFAGLQAQAGALAVAVQHAQALKQSRAQLEADLAARSEREDLLRFQLAELDRLDAQPGEDERLALEVERLRHAERLATATARAEHVLYAADQAVTTQVARTASEVTQAARYDPHLNDLAQRLTACGAELEDIAADLGRYARAIDDDPARLAQLDERLRNLRRVTARHGGDLGGAIAERERLRAQLDQLDSADDTLTALDRDAEQALVSAGGLADQLSSARQGAADDLARRVTQELATLGMGQAQVHVVVAPLTGAGDLTWRGAKLGPRGADRVEFLIAPNPGEAPRPLARVASGGELSRSLLALKQVLAGLGAVGLYVFDEVDTGVGGAVAEVIGQKLAQVAKHHQVLCITHQPQIAAYADQHHVVEKSVHGARTFSSVRALGTDERSREVARMLGGIRVSETTLRAADELLAGASNTR